MKRFQFDESGSASIAPVSDQMDFEDIVNHKYCQESWKSLLTELLGTKVSFYDQPISFRSRNNNVLSSSQIGQINLSDGTAIDLFENVISGSCRHSVGSVFGKDNLYNHDHPFKGKRILVVSYGKNTDKYYCSYNDFTLPVHSSGKSHLFPKMMMDDYNGFRPLSSYSFDNLDDKEKEMKVVGIDMMGSCLLQTAESLYNSYPENETVDPLNLITDILDNRLFMVNLLENPVHREISELMVGLRENLLIRSLVSESAPVRALSDANIFIDSNQLPGPDCIIGNLPIRSLATYKVTSNILNHLFDLSDARCRFFFSFSPKYLGSTYARPLRNKLFKKHVYFSTLHRVMMDSWTHHRRDRVSDHFVNTCFVEGENSMETQFEADEHYISHMKDMKRFFAPYLMMSSYSPYAIPLFKKLSQFPTIGDSNEIRFIPPLSQTDNDTLKASVVSSYYSEHGLYKVAHSNSIVSFHVEDEWPLKVNDALIPYPVLDEHILLENGVLEQTTATKLIIPKHKYELNAVYDSGEYWSDNSTNVIVAENEDNLVILDAILNSKVATWYLRTLFCAQIGNDECLNYSRKQLLKVPFPPVPYGLFTDMNDALNAIYASLRGNPINIVEEQHVLDSIVNRLFGLTPEEIRMMDEDLIPLQSYNRYCFSCRFDLQHNY